MIQCQYTQNRWAITSFLSLATYRTIVLRHVWRGCGATFEPTGFINFRFSTQTRQNGHTLCTHCTRDDRGTSALGPSWKPGNAKAFSAIDFESIIVLDENAWFSWLFYIPLCTGVRTYENEHMLKFTLLVVTF